MGMVMLVNPQSKLMEAIEGADRVFNCVRETVYTLTTDGEKFRIGHTEDHWPWKGHHRAAFLRLQDGEWHVTMVAPEHVDLLEDHDAGTTA